MIEKLDTSYARDIEQEDGSFINCCWTDEELVIINKLNEVIDALNILNERTLYGLI